MPTIAVDPRMRPAHTLRVPALIRSGALALVGIAGLAGLSAGAYWMLSGLAGPPPRQVRMASVASEWPDLKDGLPALAPASAPTPLRVAEPTASAKPSAEATKVQPSALPIRVPGIEPVSVMAPPRIAAIVPPARVAALIAPLTGETVRARAADTAFAALPPVSNARPKAAPATRAKAAPAPEAAPAAVAQEAEPEHTEILGLKVPSLAPAGHKIAEGVEALGNAVRALPDAF